ncbi:MAG: murein biosynthesis integral membrane protein MurJ [Ideonella sp.]|nr:murein biosynthesis integral membrane protein MurJ [Ideonella sp.]MBL0149769.1 murein biosynthesis integral membrane protein MurJ [Ideonella sp.]
MNLSKAVFSVSALTMLSRISGLVREQIGAHYFGASAMMDAFNIAFRIPNLLRRLFAEGAFSQAFVPLLATTRARDGDQATRELVDAVASILAWALLLICALGVVAAPVLVWMLASGFAPRTNDAAVLMTRWMFPYIGCMSLVALSAGILNTWRRFALPAFTPLLLNAAVITAALVGVPWFKQHGIEPVYALAAGTMLGGVLQLGIQVPALWRLGMMPRLAGTPGGLRRAWNHPGVTQMLGKMGPAVIGVSVSQISLLINSQIASRLGEGAISTITYADRLMELPIAILGVALGVVLTPQLSAAQAREDSAQYASLLDWGLRLTLLLALPCAVALLLFAQPMVATLFHRGAFTATAVTNTSAAVMGYGVGLLGLVGVKVVAPGYYARQDMTTPMRIGIAVMLLTQAFNVLLVPWLGTSALTLSLGLAALVNAGWLLIGLKRLGSWTPAPGWVGLAVRVVLASVLMGGLLFWANRQFDWIALGRHELQRALVLAGLLAGAASLYFGALVASGLNLRQLFRREG